MITQTPLQVGGTYAVTYRPGRGGARTTILTLTATLPDQGGPVHIFHGKRGAKTVIAQREIVGVTEVLP